MARASGYPLEANYALMMKDLGVRPSDVFRRAQIPEDVMARPSPMLTPAQWFAFWQALEAETGSQAFPLALAGAITAEVMSPPIFAALCSPNLIVAMQRLSDYKRLCAPMKLVVLVDDDEVALSFEWLNVHDVPPPSLVCFELVFLTKLARMATREHIAPVRAVATRLPDDMAPYADYLGVPIAHGDTLTVTFSRADAERPFLTANEAMWNTFEPELRRRLADVEESATVAERVHAVLLESLPSGQSSMETVAKRLAMSKRTLQRRLSEEGTTYMGQLNGTRERLALHYLQRTQYSCTEIAFLLGFEEPSSFFRAFHEWTGATPESLRAQLSGAAAAPA
jgi:AraC-like DNA-binding protein